MSIDLNAFSVSALFRRFGNLTAASTSEVLVSSRAYAEQGAEGQRSVKSTSAVDSNTLGTGARVVRITYLNSAYVLKTEDVALNGTLGVNTVATDIRFIECFEVIAGTEAVGAIQLMTLIAGGGTEFCGIASGTTQSFMCHHYVPAGKTAHIVGWGTVVSDEAKLKLIGQDRIGGNLVNRVFDLDDLTFGNPTPPTRIEFARSLRAIRAPEQTRVRATVVPNQSTSTIIRSYFYFLEE